jgi:alanine dehydrogenase
MKPGSVLIDVSVDQGGCIETLHPTSQTKPVYVEEGVVHYGVPNMPGAVPWTATQALNNATLPYVLQLAHAGVGALKQNPALAKGVNVKDHHIVHPAIHDCFPDLVN